jgi:transposase
LGNQFHFVNGMDRQLSGPAASAAPIKQYPGCCDASSLPKWGQSRQGRARTRSVHARYRCQDLCRLITSLHTIQTPKMEPRIMRYELTDYEWAAIGPMLPNKVRGVPRVDDRRVLNGICWVLRSGAPWRDLPDCYGPRTTCYNRFVRWRRAGVWGRIMDTLAATHDAAVQMIDMSIVRVHQHAACIARNQGQSMGRSRGGLTSKIHAVVDTRRLCHAP